MEINVNQIQNAINKAKEGDQIAFTFLLDTYWNEVYNFLYRRTQNDTMAEDITIETFSKAFDKIKMYQEEYAFNTWLIAIGKNVHIDLLRKKKASIFIELQENDMDSPYDVIDATPSVEDEIIQEQNLNALLSCIKQLHPNYQEVIQLRYFQELSYQEIADLQKETLSNIKIKIMRAKKLLADKIQEHKNTLK
ncbi:MAG: RNA polymerase sigma factor [Flavobacterium sp.]|nr:RNA polymerase sigma factor [Candidatus Neoflavobacterium equi]